MNFSAPTRILAACLALTCVQAQGVELLTDGGFEFGTMIPGWEQEESIFDQSTMTPRDIGNVDSGRQWTFKPQSGDLAYWLRAFVGEQSPDPDAVTNARLWQTVPGTPGETYTYTGYSVFELNYSGGLNMLDPAGPLGAVASPTSTTMELAFLNSGGTVIGTPVTLDVKGDRGVFPNNETQRLHTLMGTAPAGTASVRVSAGAEQMVWNGGGDESAFFDTFSLTTQTEPATELLTNPDLEEFPAPDLKRLAGFDPSYSISEVAGGNIPTDPTVATRLFANRDDSGGQLGVWLRSFTGNSAQPADAIVSQTVPGTAASDYTFTAWSQFQPNYSGGAAGFNTQTLIELAFLDGTENVIGTPLTLDVKADRESQIGGNANDANWYQHTLMGTSPAGTAFVRVSGMGLDMQTNPDGGQQSAYFDDFSLDGPAVSVGPAGDYNDDGVVNLADYTLWRDLLGSQVALPNDGMLGVPIAQSHYDQWKANFGAGPGNNGLQIAVPEPTSGWLCLVATLVSSFCRAKTGLRLRFGC